MKVVGIIFIVIAAIDLVMGFVAVGYGIEGAGSKIAGGFMVAAVGAYLVYRAGKKKREAEEKKKWENGTEIKQKDSK